MSSAVLTLFSYTLVIQRPVELHMASKAIPATNPWKEGGDLASFVSGTHNLIRNAKGGCICVEGWVRASTLTENVVMPSACR